MSTMGAIGTILMVPPILLSLPFVRHHFYNLFYYSHLFLNVGIVFLWLHASSDLYYMMPAIGLYATDILLRTIARYSPHKVRKVTPSSGGLVRIDFDIRYAPFLFHARLQIITLLRHKAVLSPASMNQQSHLPYLSTRNVSHFVIFSLSVTLY